MWSRLRTIELGAEHLEEENCKDEPGTFSTYESYYIMEGTMSQSYWENSSHPLSCTLF